MIDLPDETVEAVIVSIVTEVRIATKLKNDAQNMAIVNDREGKIIVPLILTSTHVMSTYYRIGPIQTAVSPHVTRTTPAIDVVTSIAIITARGAAIAATIAANAVEETIIEVATDMGDTT